MNKRRLLKLAEFLQHLPRQKFNFGLIANAGKKPMLAALKARRSHCGTVACAIGWMPAVFPRLLKWVEECQTPWGRSLSVALKGTRQRNFIAAQTVFDISSEEAAYLFEPFDSGLSYYAPAKEVAKHIRAFVKRGGMPVVGDDDVDAEYDNLVNTRREYA